MLTLLARNAPTLSGIPNMNSQPLPQHHAESPTKESTLDRFINELSNPGSIWYDLTVAEMSGCDYVFIPDAICRQLSNVKAIQSFLNKIQTILGSPKSRTTLISYWHDRYQLLHFERYSISWANGVAVDMDKELLDNNRQLDFIRMLFEHSEPLISA